MKSFNTAILVGTVACLLPWGLRAGTTGKIAGQVTDVKTAEALPGVNVVVDDTGLGAATVLQGRFIILNIPPGSYTLKVSMMGYAPVRAVGVMVFADRTTTQNVGLQEQAMQIEDVVIEVGRSLVEKDRTTTAAFIDAETINSLPVQELEDIVRLQAGIVADADGGLHFRGGRSREVAHLIDGVPVTDTFSEGGGSNFEVENSFVKELQVITGTFDVEYGSAQSGVINVITKDPGEEFHGDLTIYSSEFLTTREDRFLGLNNFNPVAEKYVQLCPDLCSTGEYKLRIAGGDLVADLSDIHEPDNSREQADALGAKGSVTGRYINSYRASHLNVEHIDVKISPIMEACPRNC